LKKRVIAGILLTIVLIAVIYFMNSPSAYYDLKRILSNPEEVKEYILHFGIWAPIIIILIQVVQVIITPIPGNVTALAGGAIYGVIKGFLLNVIGIVLGSVAAFYLARLYGTPLVKKLIGEQSYHKYNRMISGKYSIGLFILFFIPLTPDDALCFLAGMSSMHISIFLFFVLVGRTPGMFIATLIGSGKLQLSIPVWIALGIISILIILLFIKYNHRIENFVYTKAQKQKARFKELRERQKNK
jgi:uncharacterized membrane protein YdjX (TVP38/TMEM64 family)